MNADSSNRQSYAHTNRKTPLLSRVFKTSAVCLGLLTTAAPQAYAAGTAFGTTISNSFTVNFKKDGVVQNQITNEASPVRLSVSRLVDVTVDSIGENEVAPASTNQTLVYAVTNTGNKTERYQLNAVTEATSDFTPSIKTITAYYDDGDNVFQSDGQDGAGETFNNGQFSSDVQSDQKMWVVVTFDVAGDITGQAELVLLAATVEGQASFAQGRAESTTEQNSGTRFADGAGTQHDRESDGAHSASATIAASGPNMSFEQSLLVISETGDVCGDFTVEPIGERFVPGACIQYTYSFTAEAAVEDFEFETVMDEALLFSAYAVDNLSGATIQAPETGADCATRDACNFRISDVNLASGEEATINLRAFIK